MILILYPSDSLIIYKVKNIKIVHQNDGKKKFMRQSNTNQKTLR